jgi:hypothetical protein
LLPSSLSPPSHTFIAVIVIVTPLYPPFFLLLFSLPKVWAEFQEAAVSGAAAIAAGQVPPINPTEPHRSHVFVFNNTFFSYGVDSKDAYKVVR